MTWFLNDTLLENEDEPTLCAKASGTYLLRILERSTQCDNSFLAEVTINPDIVNCNLSSINELVLNDLRLFPNPTTDWINLTFERNSYEPITIALIDMLGKKQQQWQATAQQVSLQLNMSHLPAGAYWLTIMENNKVATYKIMKL
ncbi:MAG: T9SS type A sorting domain-containing protein [Saprospiraceae bacterium]|nr:T9SS type A sorting domain-containing protein [Saprospiraceae bacterium]